MTAAKYYDDKYYSNEYYGKVGGISNTEINTLEIKYLSLIKFKLHVEAEEFMQYRQKIIENIENL